MSPVSKAKTQGKDTGSPEAQVTFLTRRIDRLQLDHLKNHETDHSSLRGLLKMVSRRTSLMRYLARRDPKAHAALLQKLGIRK